jgi:hypothetical protein
MATIILGICEINNRQHFCGIWPDIHHVRQQLAGAYTVIEMQSGSCPYKSVKVWEAVDTNVDRETLPKEFPGFIGSVCGGFALYELDIADLPGYMPFDED